MDFDPGQLAIMGLALAGGALIKGATGMGLPLIALPALTACIGLQHAVAVMVVPITYTNLSQAWRFRALARHERMGFLPLFLTFGGIGIVIGTLVLSSLPERGLELILGGIVLLYLVARFALPDLAIGPGTARRLGPPTGLAAGVLQGATGISAPVGVTFIHSMGLEREAMVFAVSAMFLMFSVVQMVSLGAVGLLGASELLEGALALIPILIFMPLGQILANRLSHRTFDRLILVFLGLMGIKMVLGI